MDIFSNPIKFAIAGAFMALTSSFNISAEPIDSLNINDAESVAYPRSVHHQHQDEILASTHPVIINGDGMEAPSQDSIKSLIELFYVNQYRQFNDPHAPYFMFLTRDANVAMGIGGALRLRARYDWHGVQDNFAFYPYNIPIPTNPAKRKAVAATPAQSQIFFTLLGRNSKIGTYMLLLDIGYYDSGFKLRDAYLRVRDFTVGYTRSTFWDTDAYAPVVDGQGPNGQISRRSMLLRYFHTFKKGWSVGAGIEFPSSSTDERAGITEKSPDYVPDIVALGQYAWDGGDSHVRLTGIMRMLAYRDLVNQKNYNVLGWGAQLSGRWQALNPLAFYYQGVVGRGIGDYLGDLSMGKYDLINRPNDPGRMNAPLALGVTAGVEYNITRSIFLTGAFGSCRYYNSLPEPDEYKQGFYGTANAFWNITPRLQSGIGYIFGTRKNFDGAHNWMNRLEILLAFNF